VLKQIPPSYIFNSSLKPLRRQFLWPFFRLFLIWWPVQNSLDNQIPFLKNTEFASRVHNWSRDLSDPMVRRLAEWKIICLSQVSSAGGHDTKIIASLSLECTHSWWVSNCDFIVKCAQAALKRCGMHVIGCMSMEWKMTECCVCVYRTQCTTQSTRNVLLFCFASSTPRRRAEKLNH